MTLSTKLQVVVDTNVFVSGILFGGNPDIILDSVKGNQVTLLMSSELASEIMTVLHRFPLTQADWSDAKYILSHHIKKITRTIRMNKSRDPKDDMLLALSFAGHADYLVTGDKDLLVLRTFGDTQIVTPKQFVSIVSKSRK